MSRTLSSTATAALFAQQTGISIPVLIEITHGVAGYDNPLRLVNNTEDVTYDGDTYTAFPFVYDMPDVRDDGSIQNARITFCAVDQRIAAILRSTQIAPTATAIALMVDGTWMEPLASQALTLRRVSGGLDTVSAELVYEEALDNEFPADDFRPTTFPGLF